MVSVRQIDKLLRGCMLAGSLGWALQAQGAVHQCCELKLYSIVSH
jgi:hypothetical protein